MVPKRQAMADGQISGFRAVLFRMVPKLPNSLWMAAYRFRAVLFRMVPKHDRNV